MHKIGKIKTRIILIFSFLIIFLAIGIIYFSRIKVYEDIIVDVKQNIIQTPSYEIVGLTVCNRHESFVKANNIWIHENSYLKKIFIKSEEKLSSTKDIQVLVNNSKYSVSHELCFYKNDSYYYEINFSSSNGIWSKILYVFNCNINNFKIKIPLYQILVLFVLLLLLITCSKKFFNKKANETQRSIDCISNTKLPVLNFVLLLFIYFVLYKIFNSSEEYEYLFSILEKLPAWILYCVPILSPIILFFVLKQYEKLNNSVKVDMWLLGITITAMIFLSMLILFFYTYINDKYSLISSAVLSISILILAIVVILILFYREFRVKHRLLIFISSFLYFYLIVEILAFSLISLNIIPSYASGDLVLYDKIPLRKDFISGYKYIPGKIRFKRIYNGKELFDNSFEVNNMGYVSNIDFSYDKKPDTFRFIVLGDSFTAGEYISEPWPSKLNNEFNIDSIDCEFYSFALGGFGFLNWYNQFFNEITPNYEFDAVILAVFGEDINRDMIYAECVNGEVFYYRNSEIIKQIESFERINFSRKNGIVLSESNNVKDFSSFGEYNRLFPIMSHFFNSLLMGEIAQQRSDYYKGLLLENETTLESGYSSIDFVKRYGLAKYNYFVDVVNYCNENSKPIILVSIPGKEFIEWNIEKPLIINQELEFLADTFNLSYFDSYPYFAKLSQASIDSLFICQDGHWNQRGSDFFAEIFSSYLNGNNFPFK